MEPIDIDEYKESELLNVFDSIDDSVKSTPYTPKIGKLPWYRKILKYMPHHCQYCGKMFVPCYSKDETEPLTCIGYSCPDGHDGFAKKYIEYEDMKTFIEFQDKLKK